MSDNPEFGPVPHVIDRGAALPVILHLRQMDGLYRLAFMYEAHDSLEEIEAGQAAAKSFGLLGDPSSRSLSARRRADLMTLQMALALKWGFVRVEGVEDGTPGLWDGSLASFTQLVREGDEALNVPPLINALGDWMTGPLIRTCLPEEPQPERTAFVDDGLRPARSAFN